MGTEVVLKWVELCNGGMNSRPKQEMRTVSTWIHFLPAGVLEVMKPTFSVVTDM